MHLNLGIQAGVDWTDNLNNSQEKPKENVYIIAGPTLEGGLSLPLHLVGSGGENLTFSTSFSYSEEYSLSGNQNQQSFTSPVVVSLAIPFRVADWRITLGDNFVYTDAPLESALAVNTDNFVQYNNSLGLTAVRDFGKSALTLGATRLDLWTPADPANDETDYTFSLTPSVQIRNNYTMFWQNTYGFNYFRTGQQQNSEGYTSSVGVNGQITPSMNGSISLGYSHSYLIPLNLGPGTGVFGGIFNPVILKGENIEGITSTISASYAHPLRPNTTYSVAFYHSPGVTAILKQTSVNDVYGATILVNHRLTKDVTLSPVFGYTYIQNVGRLGPGQISETAELLQISLQLSKTFSQNLTGSLTYLYQSRTSNIFGNSYVTDQVNLLLHYTF